MQICDIIHEENLVLLFFFVSVHVLVIYAELFARTVIEKFNR